MAKEALQTKIELETLAARLAGTFIQRWDLYARQLTDGSFVCVRKPLETSHLIAHLEGKLTLGAYVLDAASRARYIVFDADTSEGWDRLVKMAAGLDETGVPTYLETSRRGGHAWLFFSRPLDGKQARRFGHRLLEQFNLADIELFPKQGRLVSGPGSLVRLPFGVHRKTGQRYGFLALNRQPEEFSLDRQIAMLRAPKTVPSSFMKTLTSKEPPAVLNADPAGVEKPTEPLSTRIKQRVSVFDFVSQYVELSSDGRGLCPFHDDQHESFSIDLQRNYWHCFAGCGGGSVIDFWMKLNECDFKTAVRELASILL